MARPTQRQDPRGRQDDRRRPWPSSTRPSARRSGARSTSEGDGGRHLPGVYAKACCSAQEPDERVRQRRVRHVRLHRSASKSRSRVRQPSTPKVGEGERCPAGNPGAGHLARNRVVTYIIRRLIAAVGAARSCQHDHVRDLLPGAAAGGRDAGVDRRALRRRGATAQLVKAAPSGSASTTPSGPVRRLGQGHRRRREYDYGCRPSSTARPRAWATPSSPASRSGPSCSTGCR